MTTQILIIVYLDIYLWTKITIKDAVTNAIVTEGISVTVKAGFYEELEFALQPN